MDKLTTMGMSLPVIAELGDGYFLVGHLNGPAIATEHSIAILECAAGEEPAADEDLDAWDRNEDDIPYAIRWAALKEYRKWSWPIARGRLHWNPKEPRAADPAQTQPEREDDAKHEGRH